MGVVDRSGNADGSRAARKAVRQVVGHQLDLVGRQFVVVVQNGITSRTTGSL